MLIRIPPRHPLRDTDVTPETVYRDRRRILATAGLAGAALMLPGLGRGAEVGKPAALTVEGRSERAGGEAVTDYETVSTYNNYYEFGTGKDDPARTAGTLRTRPWTVLVEGECLAPGTVAIEDLLTGLEERIYRHRCVEAWSIVVPWVGFPLGSFLQRFRPTGNAKYVEFQTLYDPEQMPLTRSGVLDWPYREGLRIDEAMHPLAFLSVGMYGRVLPNQNGAPLRLTIPWKYGFKSIKSIVAIRFTERQPATTWQAMAPREYGFHANVNPEVDHPRWSQRRERRLGELWKRDTLMFNGYPEVASLYSGMDLQRNF